MIRSTDELEALLAEQIAYYRARAPEYDATAPDDPAARDKLLQALASFAPAGRVLEFACGTGQWTIALAAHPTQLTALDASPEMLAIAAARAGDHPVRYVRADILKWEPDQRYDVVFFSAWLSHVPPQHFERFWSLVARCLTPSGRVFLIDELPVVAAHEQLIPGAVAPAVQRPLSSGSRYRAVKVFYEPDELRRQLAELGWSARVEAVSCRLFYATARRSTSSHQVRKSVGDGMARA